MLSTQKSHVHVVGVTLSVPVEETVHKWMRSKKRLVVGGVSGSKFVERTISGQETDLLLFLLLE